MQPTSFRIVVLASTNGTDLQAIIDELNSGQMPGIELTAVISNKKNCYALARARAQGYKTIHISETDLAALDPQTHERSRLTREQFDQNLISAIDPLSPDLICLIGYMRILTPLFINHFAQKNPPTPIINVHPSLIPKFSGPSFFGKSVHEAVLAAHEKETGMTIHRVTADVDAGEILLQKSVPIDQSDTPETLKQKVQQLERQYYPETIRQLAAARSH